MAQNRYNVSNIEALFRSYLSAENQNLSKTSIKNYLSDTRYFIAWAASHTHQGVDPLLEIAISDSAIRDYITHLDQLQLPPATYNRRLSSLRRLIGFLKDHELANVEMPYTPRGEQQIAQTPPFTLQSTTEPQKNMRLRQNIGRYRSTAALFTMVLVVYLSINMLRSFVDTDTTRRSAPQKLTSGRIFAFSGRLTDKLGNSISSITPVQFRLYSSQTSHSPLYQTGVCSVTPDRNGNFSVLIGGSTMSPPPPQDTCGSEVTASLFSEHASLYLGTTIASDQEMQPRKQIANVSYSSNTERLQNLPLGTSNATIPYIAADGSIVLSLTSPHLTSVSKSGTFTISSSSNVLIQSAHAGDITLNATGSGAIRMKTGSSSSDRIYISDGGNVGINTTHPAAFRLEVSGDIGPELGRAFNLGSSTRIWKDIYADRICFDGSLDCMTTTNGIFGAIDQSDGSKLSIKGDLVGGSSSTSGKTTIDIGGTGTSFALCHSSESGTDNQGIVDCSSTPTADFAEMYPTETKTEFGDIMTLGTKTIITTTHDEIRQLIKSSTPYDDRVIGVVSDNFGDFISVGHNIASSDNPMPIALKGRVPVKISQYSKAINVGDYITTSHDPGKGEKAEKSGMVIGRALESWEPGSIKNRIMVFIGTDMVAQTENPVTLVSQTLTAALAAPIKLLTAEKIVSPQIETSTLTPPAGADLVVDLKDSASRLIVKGANGHIATSITSNGDIDTQGTISARNGVFSDTIEAKTIKSSTIDLINSGLNSVQYRLSQISGATVASPSSLLNSQVFSLISQEALTSHLIVTNEATVASLSVQNAITSLADKLEIASQNTISFFKDAVVLTRSGNIMTKGTLTAGGLEIASPEGVSVASISASGSATFKRLNLSDSSGEAILPEGENMVTVPFPALRSSSHIYITPESEQVYLERPLFVKEKNICSELETPCTNSFTVAIGTSNHHGIKFSWLVVN